MVNYERRPITHTFKRFFRKRENVGNERKRMILCKRRKLKLEMVSVG